MNNEPLSRREIVTKDLIISLILQDLRHYQLTAALTKVGLDANLHDLEIMEAVAQLMGINPDDISDHWGELYFSYVQRAPEFEVCCLGEALQPLAEECYEVLTACLSIEHQKGK